MRSMADECCPRRARWIAGNLRVRDDFQWSTPPRRSIAGAWGEVLCQPSSWPAYRGRLGSGARTVLTAERASPIPAAPADLEVLQRRADASGPSRSSAGQASTPAPPPHPDGRLQGAAREAANSLQHDGLGSMAPIRVSAGGQISAKQRVLPGSRLARVPRDGTERRPTSSRPRTFGQRSQGSPAASARAFATSKKA